MTEALSAINGLNALQTIVATPFVVLNFELTNRCPFRCVMCARTNNMTRDEGLMDYELFKRGVDDYVAASPEAATKEILWLHGFGESLVHPEFDLFVAYAARRGLRPALSVNPLMLKPAVAQRLLEAQPALLYLCMDGHDNASFEAIRGLPNAYDKSKENLLAFLDLKAKVSPDTEIHLSMIDFPMNEESIRLTQAEWKQLPGIDLFLSKGFTTWDGNAPDVEALVPMPLRKLSGPVTCDFPWTRMTVAWDGDVTPCCYDYNKRYVLGSVRDSGLADIWNGKPMQALRAEFLSGNVNNSLCRNCSNLRGG